MIGLKKNLKATETVDAEIKVNMLLQRAWMAENRQNTVHQMDRRGHSQRTDVPSEYSVT